MCGLGQRQRIRLLWALTPDVTAWDFDVRCAEFLDELRELASSSRAKIRIEPHHCVGQPEDHHLRCAPLSPRAPRTSPKISSAAGILQTPSSTAPLECALVG